jgi:hypothetical protein
MSISKDIIQDLKEELDSKIRQREIVLDQLQILDVLIDKYDTIIENMDKEVLNLTKPINDVANEVKAAYDARIAAGCRTNLAWVETGRVKGYIFGPNASRNEVTIITYEVKENPATASFKPYDGIKFYSKPSNRDYGSSVVAEINGNVLQGSSVIAVNIPDQNVINVFAGIQTGDTITDDLTSPEVFSLGELPEVIGIGTTSAIGIVTTLTGGIFTSGTTFFQFGAGLLDDVEPGMLLIGPEVSSETGELEPVLQENTTIVGFGTDDYPVEYLDESGALTTSFVPCNTITIDKPALRALEEGVFTVGIITTFPALFITTSANQTAIGASFTVIRTADRDNIDANFDPLSSPNSPLKIGSISSSNLGVGSSAYYDFSGDPPETQSWRPEDARDEVRGNKNQVIVSEVKEPKVGVGQAPYNIGTTQWPIRSSLIGTIGFGTYFASYAPLGTIVRTAFGSLVVGYTSSPPGGFPPNCGELDSAISQVEVKYSNTVAQNRPPAQKVAAQTISLRTERDRKETVAYSLLQASASLRADIARLRQTLKELDGVDFTPYEKR